MGGYRISLSGNDFAVPVHEPRWAALMFIVVWDRIPMALKLFVFLPTLGMILNGFEYMD